MSSSPSPAETDDSSFSIRFVEKVGNGGLGPSFTCHAIGRINSGGLFFGDDPLAFSMPLLLLQLSLISIFSRFLSLFLKPLIGNQPLIVSQIFGGVILGPSVLGCNLEFSEKVFPIIGRATLETLSVFGFMIFIFLTGVKIDPSIILESSKQALAIGALGFFVPYALASSVRLALCHFLLLDANMCKMLQQIVKLHSMTAFPVIAIFLTELNILNSEIGRLASSSAMISDVCYWAITLLDYASNLAVDKSYEISIGSVLSIGLLIGLIVFGARPAALWAIRRTPEGKTVKEVYLFAILVALMCCGFLGEVLGVNSFISSFLLGLVIPDGPPLGAALVEKFEFFVSALLMPLFCAVSGLKTNVFTIKKWETVGVLQLVLFVCFFGKIIGTMAPTLFSRMPLRDSFSLSLVMNSRGIVELALLNAWRTKNVMTDEWFAIMIIFELVITGVISVLVKALYDPSRRFLAYKRRTILHHQQNEELRILACIHSQNNVQAVITLLDASNPSKENPIGLFVLHLIKLAGRASPLLIAHMPRGKLSKNPTQSEYIFNAFNKYEQENQSCVSLHCYEGISPNATMHNDVCSIALDNRITFVIIPFFRQNFCGNSVDSCHVDRHLIKNVLDKAPCSVGVLLDRGNLKKSRCVSAEPSSFRVAVLFFGGADDREALAYAKRMSEHPCVLITLLHFTTSADTEIAGDSERSKRLDSEILDDFKSNALHNERISYLEKMAVDSENVLRVVGLMINGFDLIMVGRQHRESALMSGLRRCNGRKELGAVGETIASMDSKFGASVLVVQQQTRVWGLRDPEESTRLRKVKL